MGNDYLKIIINEAEATYFTNWLSNSGWRYLGITVMKTSEDRTGANTISNTLVKIYLDRVLAGTVNIPSHFEDDRTDPSVIEDIIGRDFRGLIRFIRLQSSMFCNAN